MKLKESDIKVINKGMEIINKIDDKIRNINGLCEQIVTDECGIELSIDILNFSRPLPDKPVEYNEPMDDTMPRSPIDFIKYTTSSSYGAEFEKQIEKTKPKFESDFFESKINMNMAINVLSSVQKELLKQKGDIISDLRLKYGIELDKDE